MEVIFLGYNELNFDSSDGKHIEGIKFYFYYPSNSPSYHGFEVGNFFISSNNVELIKNVRSIQPGIKCRMTMGFNGKRSIFNGLSPIKTS